MRVTVLISALVLLLVANFLMIYVTPFGLVNIDGFQNVNDVSGGNPMVGNTATVITPTMTTVTDKPKMVMATAANAAPAPATGAVTMTTASLPASTTAGNTMTEGFATYTLATGGGAGDAYQPMGAFDNVKLSTGNASNWRYTAPNEPLTGPEFKPGPDELFIFKNNQCKPECCGASFSCDGGCVCTTEKQRKYINDRAGNNTLHGDDV